MVSIPFPLSTSPGLRPQDGSGRLINCFAEPRGEELGVVWRRAPGAPTFIDTGEDTSFRGGLQVNDTLFAAFENTIITLSYTGNPQGQLIPAGGLNFGSMTGSGGLVAAFDGVTNQATAASATKASTTSGYVGKTLAVAKAIFQAVVYGSNNNGYVSSANPEILIELYGRQGVIAPISATDGTLIGSRATFTDTANESASPRTVLATDNTTVWDHVWVVLTQDGAAATMSCAEVKFYETVDVVITALDALAGTDKVHIVRNNASTPDIAIVCNDGAFIYDPSGPDLDDYPDASVGSPTCVTTHLGWFIFGYGNGDMLASDLNDTNINTLNSARTESNPDGVSRLWSYQGQLFAAGTTTIEVWGDPVNDSGFPLSRVGFNIVPGLIAPFAVAGFEPEFGNPIYVASDNSVRWLQGYTPTKISPPVLDRLIAEVTDKSTLEALVYIAAGMAFWQVSCAEWTWVFNLNNGKWHERESYLLDRSRFTLSVFAFDKWLVGDTEGGSLFEVTHTSQEEAEGPLIARLESGPVIEFPMRLRVPRADFHFASGVGIATGTDPMQTDPSVMISWSDDGGCTYSEPYTRRLGRQMKCDQRVYVLNTGLSGSLGRRWRLDISDAVDVAFMGGDMQTRLRAA